MHMYVITYKSISTQKDRGLTIGLIAFLVDRLYIYCIQSIIT